MAEVVSPDTQNPRDYYSPEANMFSAFADTSFSWDYIEKPAFDKHLAHLYKPTTKVLDVGCGSGRILRHLIANGVSSTNAVGVDISGELIAIAKTNIPNAQFIEADISAGIPISNTFDLITCNLVIQHLDDEQLLTTLGNFREKLQEGGTLFYLVAHPVRVVHGKLDEYFNTGWRAQKNAWGTTMDYYHRTVSDYVRRTMEAGFRITDIDEPQVIEDGKLNQGEYKNYTSNPARLVIKATPIN